MVNKLFKKWKDIDNSIITVVHKGFKFCLGIALISILVLMVYEIYYISPDLFYIGLSLFKSSVFFFTMFIIYGLAFDKIYKEFKNL